MRETDTLRLIAEAQGGSSEAEAALLKAHGGLVRRLARRYSKGFGCLPFEDLQQEGSLALLKAARSFDPSRGVRFSTYATKAIARAMIRASKRQPRMSQEPSDEEELFRNAMYTDTTFALTNRGPSCSPRSGRGLGLSLDKIPAPEPQEPREPVDVQPFLDLLTVREREIICYKFGLGGREKLSDQQIVDALGMNCHRSRVSQIVGKALEKIRARYPLGFDLAA